MSKIKTIEFCFLTSYPTVSEAMISIFDISKSQIKKYGFKKNFLKKAVRTHDEISLPINLVNKNIINPIYSGIAIKEIYEDDTLIAVSKPSNIHSHPQTYDESDNLLSYICSIGRNNLLKVNSNAYDRGLMFRLDYATSGLMVLFKSDDVYFDIRENFHKRVKTKTYLAVVSGEYNVDSPLTHLLKAVGPQKSKIVLDDEHNADSKFSRCDVEVIEFNETENLSLLKVGLHQGHRHQIRAQLNIAGFPILGDSLYGGDDADRLFLHCYEYEFEASGKTYKLKDPDFQLLGKLFNFHS
jgi:23S rRNA pseudouridine1911/1915/1917 synthase